MRMNKHPCRRRHGSKSRLPATRIYIKMLKGVFLKLKLQLYYDEKCESVYMINQRWGPELSFPYLNASKLVDWSELRMFLCRAQISLFSPNKA